MRKILDFLKIFNFSWFFRFFRKFSWFFHDFSWLSWFSWFCMIFMIFSWFFMIFMIFSWKIKNFQKVQNFSHSIWKVPKMFCHLEIHWGALGRRNIAPGASQHCWEFFMTLSPKTTFKKNVNIWINIRPHLGDPTYVWISETWAIFRKTFWDLSKFPATFRPFPIVLRVWVDHKWTPQQILQHPEYCWAD